MPWRPLLCRLKQTIDLRTVKKILRALVRAGRSPSHSLPFARWSPSLRGMERLNGRDARSQFISRASSSSRTSRYAGREPLLRLLADGSRQRATRNLGAERVARAAPEQLG
jgi:hypothetical protein